MSDTPAQPAVTNIGSFLREQRELSKLSLEKVSQKTKINLNILRALEANDFSKLPSAAYVKGFVLSYARVLGLDHNEVIHKLEYTYLSLKGKPFPALNHTRQLGESAPATGASTTTPEEVLDWERRLAERKRFVVPALIFGGIVLVFVGLYKVVTRTVESEAGSKPEQSYGDTFAPSSEITKPPVVVAAPDADEKPKAEEPKVEEAKAEEAKPGVAEPAPPPVTTQTPARPEIRRNFPPRDFRPIKTRLFSYVEGASENTDEKVLPARIRSSLNGELENVYIVATEGNTWLSYQIDRSPIESVILEKGKDLFLQGKEVLMFLGNVRVTKVFHQNRLIDTPTPTGFKSLIFPESRNSAHVLPLFPKANDDILYSAEEYQKRMKLEEEQLSKRRE